MPKNDLIWYIYCTFSKRFSTKLLITFITFMTRINVGILVTTLTDEHLLAEHREIKRLPTLFQKSLIAIDQSSIARTFCLGKGHVNFFGNKHLYTLSRYIMLHNECLSRNFNVTDYRSNWFWGSFTNSDYQATQRDTNIIIDRITEKINSSPKSYFHYYGQRINKSFALSLIQSNRLLGTKKGGQI